MTHPLNTDAWRPPVVLPVDQWADEFRQLAQEDSAEPGQYHSSRTSYVTEPMRAMSPGDPTEFIALMWASQTAKTTTLENMIGSIVHYGLGSILSVNANLDPMGKAFARRFERMATITPEVAAAMPEKRGRDAARTMYEKTYAGGTLFIRGATSPAGLASMPIPFILLDEIDRYDDDVGGEGDPIAIAIRRANTFRSRKKIVLTSTPGLAGASKITKAFLSTDQRLYWVPCLHCGDLHAFRWEHIRWTKGRSMDAAWECPSCSATTANARKPAMLEQGEWKPSDTDDRRSVLASVLDVEASELAKNYDGSGRRKGYHLSGLYSPWRTWGEIADEFVRAKDDPVALQVVVNTDFAQPWDITGTGQGFSGDEIDRLAARAEDADWSTVPPVEATITTVGVDVQGDRFELERVGWGPGYESWARDYLYLDCDPSTDEAWDMLDEVLAAWKPDAVAIDTGGHATQQTYKYVRTKSRRRIYGVKGADGKRAVWKSIPSRVGAGKNVALYIVGVDDAKADIYARLRIEEPGPGFCHFPNDGNHEREYYEQLTAEVLVGVKKMGRTVKVWQKRRARNEALDCRVYAYAALHGLLLKGGKWKLGKTVTKQSTTTLDRKVYRDDTPREGAAPPVRQAPKRRRRPSWENL
jgi:phage terminase large subunit GpA-like protein